ncbi:hypothetical protein GCM10009533_20460 [Saccharopolyspora spinosporotrichia]|uniref:Uncharacterized protein n=1 Tax=Saccharopolyspora erythraea TaxID=1836 RepID=A0ABN1CKZ6_SACER
MTTPALYGDGGEAALIHQADRRDARDVAKTALRRRRDGDPPDRRAVRGFLHDGFGDRCRGRPPTAAETPGTRSATAAPGAGIGAGQRTR